VPSFVKTPKPKILVIVGPTCSGKTAVSLELARDLDGEIISADSRQVYKYLDIGTAKLTPTERKKIRHHFIDSLLPDKDFNAGEFGQQGRTIINDILGRGLIPIVVGGSGLYVRSLIDGFFEGPGADHEFRMTMEKHVKAGRLENLLHELRRVDPVSANSIDPAKPRRIIRALEVYHLTGVPISELQNEKQISINFSPMIFGLLWDSAFLYKRIEDRCDRMVSEGLLAEVDHLERLGYDDSLNALNTVGYAEAFAFRRGEITREEFIRVFKQNSRRYAKRQMTWFRRDERIHWIRMNEDKSVSDVAEEIALEFGAR
jgi:tRNA dimethylallyltransferase